MINWAIIGPGRIARKFAEDLRLVPGARLHAVASSSLERARAFAAEFGATHAYGAYEDIIKCPGLDVVYIATPHVFHAEHSLLCLENGLSVLCEKPFAMNYTQALQMVSAARRNRVFLMEAIWSRFIPGIQKAVELVEQGAIGALRTVKADLGFHMPVDPASRLFNKNLGGGALLDLGIYPAFLALAFLGKPAPEDVVASAVFTDTDVDESCAFSFTYPGKQMAIGHCTIAANTALEAHLYGSEGTITLQPRWHETRRLGLSHYRGRAETVETIEAGFEGRGYAFEAAHVMECLENQRLESDFLPLSFSLDLMETLDTIREKIGLAY